MENLVFTVKAHSSTDTFRECWEVFTLFDASAEYHGATYKAWGTSEEEAKQKVTDLIKRDKLSGKVREQGEVVE